MSYNTIQFEVENGVAVLTLNRPEALNSFNDEMHAEVRDTLKTVRKEATIRCLVLTGSGRGFCAGQDLSDWAATPDQAVPDLGPLIENNYNPLVKSLMGLEMPVICAVNGVAAGAGANIALACDIVLAARSASFIQAFCKIGLIPDSGGTWTLPRAVGMARAKGLSLLGDKVPAEQAEAWGMIWKCVDDDQLMEQAMSMAQHFATQPTQSLAYIKRALQASAANSIEQQLDLEKDIQTLAGRTEDYAEGVAAFIGKRKPEFKGR
jgi:2-(1,2-epoxy-1,2-dihydrophenyl)acetyl-CoA isomerase